jgi:hypothetical protein
MALILCIALFFWVSMAGAAAPVAGTGCMSHTSNASGSLSYPCTIAAGSNRAVILAIVLNSAETVSSLSFAGAAVTSVGSVDEGGSKTLMYQQVNPPTGSQNFVFTTSGIINTTAATAQFTGVHQTTPVDTPGTNVGTSGVTVNVPSAVGDLVVDFAWECCSGCGGPDIAPGAGQTLVIREQNGDWGRTGMSTEPGAASVTMSWDCPLTESFSSIGVSINPAPAAAAAQSPRRRF